MSDDVVRRLRDEITEIDREILAAVNRRLDVVTRLKRHKDEHGIAFVDPNRETEMVADRLAENGGPLSDTGLRAFYTELIYLTKS
jgi:chorismate mutase